MVSYHGPLAEHLRGALPPDLSAVVFDETGIGEAFVASVDRRARGDRFYAFPVLDNFRVARYTQIAQRFGASDNLAERAFNIAHLGIGDLDVDGIAALAMVQRDDRPWDHVREVVSLADELLVHSFSEYAVRYASSMPGFRVRRIRLRPSLPDAAPRTGRGSQIVIWPGRRDARDAIIALLALDAYGSEIVYVAPAPLHNVRARFIAATDPVLPRVLADAACIVCIDPSDPCDALEFAQRGAAVVAPLTCGASEFAPGIVNWDAGNGSVLPAAIAIARGRDPGGDLPLTPPEPPGADVDAGLVSFIVPAYDDPSDVRPLLTALAAQTYQALEAIVISDGSREIALATRGFPFVRLVTGATADAVAACRGDYVGLISPEFEVFPDYAAALVQTIVRSGAPGALARPIVRYVDAAGADQRSAGFSAPPAMAARPPAFLARRAHVALPVIDVSNFAWADSVTFAVRTVDPNATPSLRLV